jgi:hypothetical protein
MTQDAPSIGALVELLLRALRSPDRRQELVDAFRSSASEVSAQGPAWDVLSDLALDLGYYEPDPERRREARQYYGDAQLENEIRSALTELRTLGVSTADS